MNECQLAAIFSSNGIFWNTGLVLAGLWFAGYVFSWLGAWVWAWVDDAKCTKTNPMLWAIAKLVFENPRVDHNGDIWIKGKDDDTFIGLGLFFTPILFFIIVLPLSLTFWEVSLFITTVILIMIAARMGRRTHKALQRHIEDPAAHKASDN